MNDAVPPKIQEILQKAVNGNPDDFVVTAFNGNKKGDGYLGEIFFISLHEKSSGKQFNFVVKQAFSQQNILNALPIRNAFLNEINFYTGIWPVLSEFQERIPQKYRFHHLAKCCATASETNSEKLVLNNLKYEGFDIYDKRKTLPKDHFELVFRIYGKFHAMFFAYKELCPEKFAEMTREVIDVWKLFSEIDNFKDSLNSAYRLGLESLQPGVDDAVIEKYKHYITDGVDIFQKNFINDEVTTISLTHGDSWANNLMFKYDDSGKLSDIRLVDFQLVRLGPPVCDLSYCLYAGGSKENFADLNHLLQIYHDSLSECLRAYGCDPNKIYPLEAVKSEWKRYCQLGMSMSFMLWRGRLTDEEELIDYTDAPDNEFDDSMYYKTSYDKETYKQITRDLILHLYENDFLF